MPIEALQSKITRLNQIVWWHSDMSLRVREPYQGCADKNICANGIS